MSKFRDAASQTSTMLTKKKSLTSIREQIEKRLGHVITSCSSLVVNIQENASTHVELVDTISHRFCIIYRNRLQLTDATIAAIGLITMTCALIFFNNKNFTMVTTRHEFFMLYRTKK